MKALKTCPNCKESNKAVAKFCWACEITFQDWDSALINAAIAAMSAMIGHPKSEAWTEGEIASDAVEHADALISELKKRIKK